jgi:dTDP-4-amino-4,6-dideoxygalactose transaminase/NAD(P)-dependent dehydrogenase (short-subunit alcohol dehydrogenase family)
MFEMGQEESAAADRVIKKKQLLRYGPHPGEVDAFEERFRKLLGVNHFLGLSNGTGALICGLLGLEIGPGDEVIVPGFTFMASALAVLNAGAIPVIAEIDETLGLDPADVERKISKRTKAVMPVHMFGLPSDMGRLCEVAKRHNLKIIEDSCQAFGGQYKGRWLGTFGDAGAFSFNDHMLISAGEGGGLAISDRTVYERALIYHDGGAILRSPAGELQTPLFAGDNYRMSEVQAAILDAQLNRVDSLLHRLRTRKKKLHECLAGCVGLRLTPSNDEAGDCGTNFNVLFENASQRKAVCERLFAANPRHAMCSPMDFGRYAYSDWSPLLSQRGACLPAQNPYLRPENQDCQKHLGPDSCPRTLDILGRTGCIFISLRADLDFYEEFAAALRKTTDEVRAGLPPPPASSAAGSTSAAAATFLGQVGGMTRPQEPAATPGAQAPEKAPASALKSEHAAALAARARALAEISNGCPQAAIAIFKSLTKVPELRPLVHNDLGVLYYHLERFSEAMVQLRLATQFAPGDPNTWRNLANTCLALKRQVQAAEPLRRLLQLEPQDQRARHMLAEIEAAAHPRRNVLITGVTRGLGRAMAEEFIRLGHHVWGCGRSQAEIEALRSRFPAPNRFDVVDVSDDQQVRAWAASLCLLKDGGPDLLINNAGVIHHMARLWQVPNEDFARVLDVNVKGIANVIRHFVPAMIQRNSGVIVNISSGWGRSVSAEAAPYCAAKFAVEGMTQALALELPASMAAVPLSPGMIKTDMLRSSMDPAAFAALTCPTPPQWARKAVPFILHLAPKDNGKPLSIN